MQGNGSGMERDCEWQHWEAGATGVMDDGRERYEP